MSSHDIFYLDGVDELGSEIFGVGGDAADTVSPAMSKIFKSLFAVLSSAPLPFILFNICLASEIISPELKLLFLLAVLLCGKSTWSLTTRRFP